MLQTTGVVERKGTYKVEYLRQIESEVQKRWDEEKIFESDALNSVGRNENDKFFTTFPFPYMNGRLHLGHTFSLSKCEFAVRYNRLKGKRVLFPFAFHCTGMPIKACADKLKREMELYGFPPVFPINDENANGAIPIENDENLSTNKSKGKKSKAIAKSGNIKYQWQIMQSLGLTDEQIKAFANPSHWLDYFPPLAVEDLRRIGIHVDWRRTFITTDANPYFDSFIRWQFMKLKDSNKIKYGKRFTAFSPKENQPCMDHDRASGEGVGPQEYTLIKLKLLHPFPPKLKQFEEKSVCLVAATLRPETVYGQTNCWVGPDMQYIAFEIKTGEIFVCSNHSARNMAYQEYTKKIGSYTILLELTGQDLLGVALKPPLSFYTKIYTLPMLTINENKGTGIVMCVPSDSPDDYAALTDLKRKQPFREKYGILDEMVLPFEPIPIIDVPEFGNLSAVYACNKFNVQSQNDREKLQEAKEMVYLKGFYNGVMIFGEFKGRKIQEIKKPLQTQLINNNYGLLYYEPEQQIMSRSGDECVVALCDQWYLDYGEKEWKNTAINSLSKINTYHEEVRKNFVACFNWLHEHACSRKYGLGTKVPFDEKWLIESLSDSTIYNAYYTVSHILQEGTFKGENVNNGIRPEYMTRDVWDYIFLKNAPFPKNCKISKKVLKTMRNEFRYWYPVDLRCSGKDLIQNHLTFYIYNHCAIWPNEEDLWPKSIRANGHLLLNSAKMSKSEGNFLTLSEAVKKYSADGMRLCLADAGDFIEDANFVDGIANAGILKLYTFIEWVIEMKTNKSSLRSGPSNSFHDKVFLSEMNLKNIQTDNYYKSMLYKEALRTGFFELQAARDKYRELTMNAGGMHHDLIFQFIELQALLLSPICPHVSEHIWKLLGYEDSIVRKTWPIAGSIVDSIVEASNYLIEAAHSFRIQKKNFIQVQSKKKKNASNNVEVEKPNRAVIYIAKTIPPWQTIVTSIILDLYQRNNSVLPDNKVLASVLNPITELKKHMKKVMPFVQTVKEKTQQFGLKAFEQNLSFDEHEVLNVNLNYLKSTLELDDIDLKYIGSEELISGLKEDCCPGVPHILFFTDKKPVPLKLINPFPQNGLFAVTVDVLECGTVEKAIDKIRKELKFTKDKKIEVWRFKDPLLGPRKMPNFNDPLSDKEKVDAQTEFDVENERIINIKCKGNRKLMGDTAYYIVK